MDTKKTCSNTEMNEMKLADEYDVDPLDYADVSLINIGLSIGAINNLMKEGVHTVCDLLNLTESELYGIKNIGKKSVEKIRKSMDELIKNDGKALVWKSINNKVSGGSKIKEMPKKEKSVLKKYKEEIGRETQINKEKVIPITRTESAEARRRELMTSFDRVPKERHYLDIYPFIDAYPCESEHKRVLKDIFYKKDKVIDIVNKDNISDEYFGEFVKFVDWLCYDLKIICRSYLERFYADNVSRTIIEMRAGGMPLKDICEVSNADPSKIYALEKAFLKNIKAMLNRHNFFKMIAALNGGSGMVRNDVLLGFFGDYKEALMFYLRKLFKDTLMYDSFFEVYCLDQESALLLQKAKDVLPKEIDENDLDEVILYVSGKTGVSRYLLDTMVRSKYEKTGNFYHVGKLSNVAVFGYVLKKYYPEGIRINTGGEVDEFYNKAIELYGESNLPRNRRVIANVIAKVGVHGYRGVYIHRDYISIPKSVLDTLDSYILRTEKDEISAYELFLEFYDTLVKETNIKNHYMLFGVLKYELESKYVFKKNYVIAKPKLL